MTVDQNTDEHPDQPDENDQNTAQEPHEDAQDGTTGPEGTSDAEQAQNGAEGQENGREHRDVREAVKYRKRAQEAEAERDTLREQLTGVRTSILEGIVGDDGAPVEAILAAGYSVDGFFGDDGRPDVKAIEAARVDTEKRFKIRRQRKLDDRTPRTLLGGSDPQGFFEGNGWAKAFSPKR